MEEFEEGDEGVYVVVGFGYGYVDVDVDDCLLGIEKCINDVEFGEDFVVEF